MPLIGDELRTILGMMPTRDRAGIARGTMADDAVRSSAAADSGNAEGHALMQQGGPPRPAPQAPPQVKLPPMGGPGGPPPGDIQLPANVPTAYASGSGGGSSAALPAPSERVVAASPAAAPSAAVATRASDVMMAALQQRERQAKMMSVIGNLGILANSIFNRNPTSQAATKSSLAGMVGGGGGGGGGNPLAEIKTISDMKRQEETDAAAAQDRAAVHGALMKRGLTSEEAAVEIATGKAGERIGATADENERKRLTTESVKAKLRPRIKELAALDGSDPDVLAAQLETDPSKVFELMTPEMRAKVQKTLTDTEKTKFENLETGAHMTSWANARKDPEAFMKRFGITDPAQAAPMLDDFGAMREFLKNSTPMHDELQRRKRDIQADRDLAAGGTGQGKRVTTEQVIGMGKETPDLETQLQLGAGKGQEEEYRKELKPKAEAAAQAIKGQGMIIGDMFSKNLASGGKLSQLGLDVRKTIATALKMPISEKDINTEAFFGAIGRNILSREGTMKGALSNADMTFLHRMNGDMTMTPESIRRLQHIEEKLHRYDIEAYRERYERDQANTLIPEGTRKVISQHTPVEQPRPTKLTDDIVKEQPKEKGQVSGLQTVKQAVAAGLEDDPIIQRQFNERFGHGLFKQYVDEVKRGAAK